MTLLKVKPYFWSQLLLGLMAILTFAPTQANNATLNPVTCLTQCEEQEQNILKKYLIKFYQHQSSSNFTNIVKKISQISPTFLSNFFTISIIIRAGPSWFI